MKRCLLLLAALAAAPAVYAQPSSAFTREDILAVFAQYNPSVLEQARQDPEYQRLVEQAADAYVPSGVLEPEFELAALAKNFDASILLYALGENYREKWLLQQSSGLELNALDEQTQADLQTLFSSVFDVTLDVYRLQTASYRRRLKALKKDKTLSKSARREAENVLKAKIKDTKTVIKNLKKDRSSSLPALAKTYLQDLQRSARQAAGLEPQSAEQTVLEAAGADNLQIKTKNKKPVAE